VRYRTHDLTRVLARSRCDCGRTALRLDRLRGRTDDMVIFKGVNFYPRQIETILLRQPGASHEYQIVLDGEGGGERLSVLLEVEPGCDPGIAARIRRELHDLLALSPEVRVLKLGEIERPQGKAVRVVDRRTVR
jgi:phenylacetate-CoA ligase